MGKSLLSSEGSNEPDCVSGFSLTGQIDKRTNLREGIHSFMIDGRIYQVYDNSLIFCFCNYNEQ